MTKILGISFETIDTKIVAASLAQLKNSTPCETSIFAGDPYQVNYTSALQDLERIKNQYKIPIFTIKECLEKQYQEIEKIDVSAFVPKTTGAIHPITETMNKIIDFFIICHYDHTCFKFHLFDAGFFGNAFHHRKSDALFG